MSKTSVSLEERQKIKDSLKATKERRKTQVIKVFELKVNCHHTSKETFKKSKIHACRWTWKFWKY